MARLLTVEGHDHQVVPRYGGTTFTLEELQGYVGGNIEMVDLGHDEILIVNDEGKIHNLPINPIATLEWVRVYGYTDVISGDALIVSRSEIE